MGWRIYVAIFVAGFFTSLGTGVGTIPLFWADDISDRFDVGLWGLAGGLMASASIFGLGYEMYRHPGGIRTGLAGVGSGILLVIVAHGIIDRLDFDYDARDIAAGNLRTVASVFLVLLVHSFPEGLAIGVSFAHLQSTNTLHLFGFAIPVLAVIMTVTIAVHNMPEGVAIGVPLAGDVGIGDTRMFGAAVFSSLPQPIGAVVAYAFLQLAEQFLEFGYGFAAGAMLYLVVQDIIPEGLESGEDLEHSKRVFAIGAFIGFVGFMPLILIL